MSTKCEYHDFQRISGDETGQVEVCKLCGERKVYKVVNGQIDNVQYLKDHARDFAQREGRTAKIFQRFYGDKKK